MSRKAFPSLARTPDIEEHLRRPPRPERASTSRHELRQIDRISASSDVFLIDISRSSSPDGDLQNRLQPPLAPKRTLFQRRERVPGLTFTYPKNRTSTSSRRGTFQRVSSAIQTYVHSLGPLMGRTEHGIATSSNLSIALARAHPDALRSIVGNSSTSSNRATA